MYWLPAEPGEAIGKGDDRWHAPFPDQPIESLRQVLAQADPIRFGQAAAGEADKIETNKGSLCPSCPAGTYTSTIRIDGSPSMVPFEGALDRDAADATRRPEELTHALGSWVLLI